MLRRSSVAPTFHLSGRQSSSAVSATLPGPEPTWVFQRFSTFLGRSVILFAQKQAPLVWQLRNRPHCWLGYSKSGVLQPSFFGVRTGLTDSPLPVTPTSGKSAADQSLNMMSILAT